MPLKSRIFILYLAFCVTALGQTPSSADVVLYDSSLGSVPGDQGWISVIGPNSTESLTGGLLNLDTTATHDDQSGYFSESPFNGDFEHPVMPVLDSANGYRIRFDLQVVSESHATRDDNGDGLDDRAGFSLISISENLDGLELAFFENRVWAYADASEGQNSMFTQSEGVSFDTTAALTTYDLVVASGGYELYAEGNFLLAGALRNYNPSGLSSLIDPYDNPSFLFFGDDTTSAASHVRVGSVQVLSVPEPTTIPVALIVLSMTWLRRRRGSSGVVHPVKLHQ